jgi:acetyl-CoA carboxylase carboxyltransferase component
MHKNVNAPLTGVVIEVAVSVGQAVAKGDLLILLESMKVQLRVEADCDGLVRGVFADLGDTIQRDAELVSLEANHVANAADTKVDSNVGTSPHSLIQEFYDRQALSLDQHRSEAAAKRHSKGYQTARENLARLCDPKSFQEYGQFAVAAQRQRHDYQTLKTSSAADGIITGIGQVNGQSVALVVNDYSVMAGTQGYFHHQKLDRILAVAGDKKLPVIMFTEGGGGRPGDTDVTVVNSGLQCASFGTWAGLSGLVPRISVANGYNFAGNAALFGAADITIATKHSWIGMAGPAMIEGGGLGTFKATDIGPIEVQSSNGTVDIVVEDEAQAADVAVKVLGYFQTDESDWQANDQAGLQRILPENRRQTYQVRGVIEQLVDQGSFTELCKAYGPSMVTGLARIEGKALGIIANDCTSLGGAIDVSAGDKAAKFMQLCDQFKLPIISLCDTPGFMVGPDHETQGAVRRLAEMFRVGSQISTPFYAVILRKCYGLGAQAMLGGSTQRPLYTLSWPTGEFGAMGLEGAVRLGFSKELAAITNAEQQKALFEKLLAQQYERGQAAEVASVLEIDAVIDPADTRAALATLLKSRL